MCLGEEANTREKRRNDGPSRRGNQRLDVVVSGPGFEGKERLIWNTDREEGKRKKGKVSDAQPAGKIAASRSGISETQPAGYGETQTDVTASGGCNR